MHNAVPYQDLGVVSSLGQFGRTTGQIFGPAFGATLMAVRFEAYLDRYVAPDTRSSLDGRELTELDVAEDELDGAVLQLGRRRFKKLRLG